MRRRVKSSLGDSSTQGSPSSSFPNTSLISIEPAPESKQRSSWSARSTSARSRRISQSNVRTSEESLRIRISVSSGKAGSDPHQCAGAAGCHQRREVLGADTVGCGLGVCYPNKISGNHAAFFLRHGPNGIWVIDQYKGKKHIASRFLPSMGKNKDGSYLDPSNNADAFSVIE